jgi:two-component system response regulator PilR (NtrC family)
LFLDEVADLPLHMQVKLLRVIQEKTLRPVGETAEQSVDIRLLSATHKNLAEQVALGRFREDLFYRINVIEMRVPALRERTEDIPELAAQILRRLARRSGVEEIQIEPEVLQQLSEYSFPGNVRELENILERALTLSTTGNIRTEDIRLQSFTRGEPRETAPSVQPVALGSTLQSVEREAIVRALEQHRYNKTATARALGMTFRALRYRIKKLGIE